MELFLFNGYETTWDSEKTLHRRAPVFTEKVLYVASENLQEAIVKLPKNFTIRKAELLTYGNAGFVS